MGNSYLTKVAQGGAKLEGTVGTAEALVAADYAGNFEELDHEYVVQGTERSPRRAVLGSLPDVKGGRQLRITGRVELTGGAAATVPPWWKWLRGMGFNQVQLSVFALGSITNGPFRTGDVIGDNASQASATKTAVVMAVLGTPNRLVILPLTGTFADTNNVFAYRASGSQPSSTVSGALANAGYGGYPVTDGDGSVHAALTAEHREAGQVHKLTAGRGKGVLSFEMNKPAILGFEVSGCPVVDAVTGEPATGGMVAAVPAAGVAPLACKDCGIQVDTWTPVFSKIEVQLENELAERDAMGTNAFQSSGYVDTRITGRSLRLMLDPEWELTPFAIIGRLVVGTVFPLAYTAGSVAHGNGMTSVVAPACQVRAARRGDKNGIKTADKEILLTVADLLPAELFVGQVFVS